MRLLLHQLMMGGHHRRAVLRVRLETRTTLTHVRGHMRIMRMTPYWGFTIPQGSRITLVIETRTRVLAPALRRGHTFLLLTAITEPDSNYFLF